MPYFDYDARVQSLAALLIMSSVALAPPAFAKKPLSPGNGPTEVDCPNDNLQEKLDEAEPGDVIFFIGYCENSGEPFEITVDGLTLDGDPDGDGFKNGTIGDQVSVIGADNVVLRNFDLETTQFEGGPSVGFGIESRSSTVEVRNVIADVDYPFAVGFYAYQNGTLVVSDSEAWVEAPAATGFCNSNAASANVGSVLVSEGGNNFNSSNTGVCASNGSTYRQLGGWDIIEAPFPAAASDVALTDIRGADMNAETEGGELKAFRNSVLRVSGSNFNWADVRADILSSCAIPAASNSSSWGLISSDDTSVCFDVNESQQPE